MPNSDLFRFAGNAKELLGAKAPSWRNPSGIDICPRMESSLPLVPLYPAAPRPSPTPPSAWNVIECRPLRTAPNQRPTQDHLSSPAVRVFQSRCESSSPPTGEEWRIPVPISLTTVFQSERRMCSAGRDINARNRNPNHLGTGGGLAPVLSAALFDEIQSRKFIKPRCYNERK